MNNLQKKGLEVFYIFFSSFSTNGHCKKVHNLQKIFRKHQTQEVILNERENGTDHEELQ